MLTHDVSIVCSRPFGRIDNVALRRWADVAEERAGKMVYSVKFESGKEAGTLKQELARLANDYVQNEPETIVKASVKPGRYPGTFELLGIES